MAIIKTGVSMEMELFEKAEEAAAKLNISRSRFYQLALGNYIRQYENLDILNKLNSAYADNIAEQEQEQDFQKLMKTYHKKHLEDKW